MILPNAISVFFLTAAATEAASSGNDVPQAISVNEMKASFTPKDFAMSTALSTNKSQLVISNTNPPTTLITANHKGVASSASTILVILFFLSREKEYHIKNTKAAKSNKPSIRLIVAGRPSKKLNARTVSNIDTATHRGISNFIFFLSIAIGKHNAVTPAIPRILKILEPTTLPIATSAFPFNAPKKLTTNSGIEVPTPTIAAPITKSDTRYFLAMDTAPATR